MIVEYPLLWATLLYILGVLVGGVSPSLLYIVPLVLTLIGCTLFRKRRYVPEVLTVAFWILLGGTRISMTEVLPEAESSVLQTVLEEKAREQNDFLLHRLQKAGMKDETLELSAAMLLGRRGGMSGEVREAYSDAGVSHLLSLSGLHLSILYGVLYFLLIRRIRFSQWRWFALPVVLLGVWGYAFLTGFSVSLVRAAIMCSIVTVSTFSQGQMSPMHPLAVSALLILLWSPAALYSISFQLSFLAVFFIFALYMPLKRVLGKTNCVVDMLLLSAVAQLGTAPLVMYYFHTLPLVSLIANLFLIPLTTIIVYLGLTLLLFPLFPLSLLMTGIVRMQNAIVRFCVDIPYAQIDNLYLEKWQVWILYAIILCAVFRLQSWFEGEEFSR